MSRFGRGRGGSLGGPLGAAGPATTVAGLNAAAGLSPAQNPATSPSAFGVLPPPPGSAPRGSAFGGGVLNAERPAAGYQGQWIDNIRPMGGIDVAANQYGPVANVTGRLLWESPLFDLRGDLEQSNAYATGAVAIPREVLLGTHRTLYVTIDAQGLDLAGAYRLSFVTKSAAVDPAIPVYDSKPVDITTELYAGRLVSAGRYTATLKYPVYDPVRYWGLALVLDVLNLGSFPAVMISGALH